MDSEGVSESNCEQGEWIKIEMQLFWRNIETTFNKEKVFTKDVFKNGGEGGVGRKYSLMQFKPRNVNHNLLRSEGTERK